MHCTVAPFLLFYRRNFVCKIYRNRVKRTIFMKYKEYDVIYSLENINEKISAKTKGVILLVLSEENHVYEVEFVDLGGKTIDTIAVQESQITHISP